MPADMFFPTGADYWTPAAPRLTQSARRAGEPIQPVFDGLGVFHALGRLRAGTPLRAAQLETDPFLKGLAERTKFNVKNVTIAIVPLVDHIFGQARPALLALMAAVVLVLLIAWHERGGPLAGSRRFAHA